ncbi:probable E3 ubiquitin ligase SUD1 [Prosopis cineraria]|uniref:probable E3 ubiquitin ligase SUD1 n=1 Tax=Prosopis cineraria TaxID=364024 RepID=UPI0024104E6D|nr:probable E3 ubiquitin ligase SUD1 [Prosopis cineraria]
MSYSDNMNEDRIIAVCLEQVSVQTTPSRQSSSSSNDVVISVDEISVFMEDITNVTHLEAAAASSGEIRLCRFCHEEDLVRHLEAPCACSGTIMYAHRRCTTDWCNTKGDIRCEICQQPYGPDYAVTTESTSSTQTRQILSLFFSRNLSPPPPGV